MNSKMGRNPFVNTGETSSGFKPSSIPKKSFGKKVEAKLLSAKRMTKKSSPRKLKELKPWQGYSLEQATFFRIRKDMGQWNLQLLNIGIQSAKTGQRKTMEWKLLNRGPLRISAFCLNLR